MRNTGSHLLTTPRGDARLTVDAPNGQTNGVALLFHGAGGGSNAPVLLAARDALVAAGWTVARLDQPYALAGRRAPAPVPHLDEVALLAVDAVRDEGPLLLAGKSNGARVACRIAAAARAVGVVAFGFPLHPPGRPEKSRADELNAGRGPVLVLQGSRDAFGAPDEVRAVARRGIRVVEIEGADHSLRTHAAMAEVAAQTVRFAQART